METLSSSINISSTEFKQNSEHHRALANELRERLSALEFEHRKLFDTKEESSPKKRVREDRGPVVRRGQLPARVLAHFQNHPTSVFTTDELAEAIGLTDRAIHDATQVIAFFNYINRVADGLGGELEKGMPAA